MHAGVDAAVTLGELLRRTGEVQPREVTGSRSVALGAITHDSRRVGPGTLFCCLPGAHADGHDFAPTAVQAGAVALLVERRLDLPGDPAVSQVVVADARVAMGYLSAAFFARPSERLRVVGVTGTNGKTTTTHLLAAVLEAHGWRTGILGTLSGVHTTPEAPDLQARLAAFVHDGVAAVAMEVSSHALALHRVDGTRFAAGVFTNLGRDHLDLHGTMERYFAAKARLFERGRCAIGVVNVDDVHGRLLLDAAEIPMTTFSLGDVRDVEIGPTHHAYTWRGQRVRVGIGGRFNVRNSLAAATVAQALDVPLDTIVRGLGAAGPVPGRFEPVDSGQDFTVVVDYAHTPDGLEEVLATAREVADGRRVIVVFGCGGDRDREKRPEMGEVAARLADVVVVTSDNPRSEDPGAIIAEVLQGVPAERAGRPVHAEPDRRAAIGVALRAAGAGDVVVIAGKGHETTQTIGEAVVPFDDRLVARALLEEPA
jgi:UDP-N-acetylmuramoyl-L-alanyl-D-glutamate--2,6-diaminopimelate ligase